MARPKSNERDKRQVQVNIRLTIEEAEKVTYYAKASGITPANWIRKKIFTGKFPPVKLSPIDAATYHELKKIGVNLNQATHKINSGEFPRDYLVYILSAQAQLQKILTLMIDDREPG